MRCKQVFTWVMGALAVGAGCSASGSVEGEGGGGGAGSAAAGGAVGVDAGGSGGAGLVIPDPRTCEEAEAGQTYVGCEFWPTVTDNVVAPSFDFAVVVANTGDAPAELRVERNGAVVTTATVAPKGLTKLYLPWVPELKSVTWLAGQPDNNCPTWVKVNTVNARGGAYHLTSTRPVAVYQFNAIEYAGRGGPPGKDWSFCQSQRCTPSSACFSYTNDASLLLPSTALTGTYRVAGSAPWTRPDEGDPGNPNPSSFTFPAYFAVTGTVADTDVTVQLSATASIAAGGGVPATGPGGTARFRVSAGDVVMVVGTPSSDFSGTLVRATKPVQVISGIACTNVPAKLEACDHLEESVLPAETLGRRYFVTRPTGPDGQARVHTVRLYGNVDGTRLRYPSGNPGGPATLDAGQFVQLDSVSSDFEVVGDHEFIVASFQHGAGPMSGARLGDPSQSTMTTVEQYRLEYIFLAPDDYAVSYADVVMPLDATLQLDGAALSVTPTPIGSGYGVARVGLPAGSGAHRLEASAPVGLQVMGYGDYTSYQYPGGLNLGRIAPVPPR